MSEASRESAFPKTLNHQTRKRYFRYALIGMIVLVGGMQYAELLGEKSALEFQRQVYMTAACNDRDHLKYVLDEVIEPDDNIMRLGVWQEVKTNLVKFCDDIQPKPTRGSFSPGELAYIDREKPISMRGGNQ